MLVDIAVYEDGRRLPGLDQPASARAAVAGRDDRFAWIGLVEPTADELELVSSAYDLHPLAVEDAVHAQQRPKLESYDHSLFVVIKTAQYVDSAEVFKFGEVLVFVSAGYVITVRHGVGCDLALIRADLEAHPERLALGPAEVLHAIADHIVDRYELAVEQVESDIDEVQVDVFSGASSRHAERIFKLKREVLEFRQAVGPLEPPIRTLATRELAAIRTDQRPYFLNVLDHVTRVTDQLETFDSLLDGALTANVAQVGMRQNEDMRKISAWVAIAAVPTAIAGLYGMNFEHMPELTWVGGYPMALGLIVVICALLYRNFKRRGWL